MYEIYIAFVMINNKIFYIICNKMRNALYMYNVVRDI